MRRLSAALLGLLGAAAAAAGIRTVRQPDVKDLVTIPAQYPGWPRRTRGLRVAKVDRTDQFVRDLGEMAEDDGDADSPLWRDMEAFTPPQDLSYYWDSLCNGSLAGINMDEQREEYLEAHPLEQWEVVTGMYCVQDEQLDLGKAYTSEAEAAEACGPTCGAVYDVGCTRTDFRTCQTGFEERTSGTGGCLRMRPPSGEDAATPQPPTNEEFWKSFCAIEPVRFRVLFADMKCAAGTKDLTGFMPSEAACADLVKADPGCSDVFDFKFGTVNECRCATDAEACQATAAEGTDTFIIE